MIRKEAADTPDSYRLLCEITVSLYTSPLLPSTLCISVTTASVAEWLRAWNIGRVEAIAHFSRLVLHSWLYSLWKSVM